MPNGGTFLLLWDWMQLSYQVKMVKGTPVYRDHLLSHQKHLDQEHTQATDLFSSGGVQHYPALE